MLPRRESERMSGFLLTETWSNGVTAKAGGHYIGAEASGQSTGDRLATTHRGAD